MLGNCTLIRVNMPHVWAASTSQVKTTSAYRVGPEGKPLSGILASTRAGIPRSTPALSGARRVATEIGSTLTPTVQRKGRPSPSLELGALQTGQQRETLLA